MQQAESSETTRLHYLDWLRLGAILSVFVLHCAKVFDFHTETVFNAEYSLTLIAIREFILMWVMPLFFVISGAAIFANQRALGSVRKYALWTSGAAAALTIFYIGTRYGMGGVIPGLTSHDMSSGQVVELSQSTYAAVGMQFLRGLIGWLWVIGLVGLGMRFLRRDSRGLKYSNEATLPFYILHHAVIYVFAYIVIQWNLGVGWKFLSLLAISFAMTLALYEILIRRLNAMRFLFGMKTEGHIWGIARRVPADAASSSEGSSRV